MVTPTPTPAPPTPPTPAWTTVPFWLTLLTYLGPLLTTVFHKSIGNSEGVSYVLAATATAGYMVYEAVRHHSYHQLLIAYMRIQGTAALSTIVPNTGGWLGDVKTHLSLLLDALRADQKKASDDLHADLLEANTLIGVIATTLRTEFDDLAAKVDSALSHL